MDPTRRQQLRIAGTLVRCAFWTALFAAAVYLLTGESRSAPQPAETEAWRLLAQRVETLQFRRFIAEGNVEVRWGSRSVRAHRVEGDMESGWIVATGDVTLTSELGTLHATQARVNLLTREGELSNVKGKIEGILIIANTLRSDGSNLHMQKVALTTCDKDTPDYLLSASSLTLSPALRLYARHVSLSLWGKKWVTVPYLSRRIGKREPGEPLFPQVGYSRRRGVMIYYGDLVPQPWAQVRYNLRIFTRHDPEVRVELMRRLDTASDGEPLRRLEPTERGNVSFLETLSITNWRAPMESRRKHGVFLSLLANSPVEVLQRTDLYLRGVELGYQTRQPLFGGLLETEWRVGRLRESPTMVTASRATLLTRWQSPTIDLGKRTSTDVVFDARTALYDAGKSYSWARIQWSVYLDVDRSIQLGAGLSFAATAQKSPFIFDTLETRREARFRTRIIGKWGLDILGAWDLEHQRWRDWQIGLLPPAHCIQPQISWSYQQRQIQLQLSLITR